LRTNYLPEVWIPDEQVLKLRDLTRHKSNLTRMRVEVQVKLKGYLLRKGTKYGKLWNEKALSELAEGDPDMRNLIRVYWSLKAEEKEVKGRIKKTARNMKKANLLMSMTGIGELSALVILAEVGDIKRFKTPKELVSYAGLCPGIYQSADIERNVRNNAVNKWLKWSLYECSGRAAMLDSGIQEYFYKVKQRKGFKIARRAVARKMLMIIWYMLTNEEPYRAS
jgi:transposase